MDEVAGAKLKLSLKRRLAYAGIVYATFLLLLLAVEGIVRLTLPHLSSLDLFVVTPQQKAQVADEKQSTIFEGDPLLLWRLRPNLKDVVWDFTVVSTNAQHLRADRPLEAKQPGTFRIVSAGDSVTFGYRVPVVWPHRPTEYDRGWLPYPMLLEKELQAANPNRRIEAVNLSVPGYTSHQGLAWLKRDLANLKPDLVTLSYGWNDASRGEIPDRESVRTNWSAWATRWLMHHSQAFAHASRWLQSKSDGGRIRRRAVLPRVTQAEYISNMNSMIQLARSQGAAVIVIAAPYRDAAEQLPEAESMRQNRMALRAEMERNQIPFLEVRELTEDAAPTNHGWFGERIHPNHMGHRLIAAELLELIKSQGLVKDLQIPSLVP